MSAIGGIIQLNDQLINSDDIENFNQALAKYPADNHSMWKNAQVFMSCRMQWVTPESVQEVLPYYDQDVGLVIAADAIIDNRDDVFDRLQIGRDRRGQIGDCELILQAYIKWGQDAPKFLIGDFAFMIWDHRRKQLFGARDLLGMRNLYYGRHGEKFAFSTAIAPLLTLPGYRNGLNETWLSEFLTIPSLLDSVDANSTVYRGISQVPPGHSITVTHQAGSVLSHYGGLIPTEPIVLNSSGEYVEAFREVFQTAVRSRLRSIKPVGATLSGGLDSSSVVSIAAKSLSQQNRVLKTYSMIPVPGFEDWTSKNELADESEYVQSTINYVGNLESKYLASPGISPLSEVDDLLAILEMPYKNFENTYRIKNIFEHAAQDGAGVLLTGVKGNYTISWGSAIDYYSMLLKRLQWLQFYRQVTLFSKQTGVRRKRLMSVIRRNAFPSAQMISVSGASDIASLISPAFAHRTRVMESLQNHDVGLVGHRKNVLEERKNYFQNLGALNLQGTFASKVSLRYRLWERDPTSDPRLVRFCLSVPLEQFVHGGIGRSLIRRATEHELPDKVRLNQRIRGAQGVDWVQRMIPEWSAFMSELHHLCNDSYMSEFLDVKRIRTAMEQVGTTPKPEHAGDPDAKYLMRSIIISRFLKKFA